MNERILELAKQCGYWSGQTIEMNNVGIKKFAELIVGECAEVIDDIPSAPQGSWSDGYYEGCRDSAKKIKQHFGVKE